MLGRLELPADENLDLEELERFAKEFKQRRIKLGKDRGISVDGATTFSLMALCITALGVMAFSIMIFNINDTQH